MGQVGQCKFTSPFYEDYHNTSEHARLFIGFKADKKQTYISVDQYKGTNMVLHDKLQTIYS